MIAKQRRTVSTGGALALAGLVWLAGTGATTAAEPLGLVASHRQLAAKSNPNGTATMTLAITLSNTGSVAAKDLRLVLLSGPGLAVRPGANVLAVGALAAGQSVTLVWPVTMLAPVAANRVPLMVVHAEGVAADTSMRVSTGVLSRTGNNPRAKANSAGSTTEPVAAETGTGRRGRTERVSVDSAGNQGAGGKAFGSSPAISADGCFVAFDSAASNLVPGDTNNLSDIFVHDRKTGVTERVSVDSAGNQATGSNVYSAAPAISADGRFVAFVSSVANLVPGDTNGAEDIFVHDRKTGVTERVSVDSAGNQADGYGPPQISVTGRFVAFNSFADNLVPGDTNGTGDVFVHDRKSGVTERVSVDSIGREGNNMSLLPTISVPMISADGRFIAFWSYADNLVPGDTNGVSDAFVHDRKTGTTERISVDSAGNQGRGNSADPAISLDGRFVAFWSVSDNLVPEDTNGSADIFVRDRRTGVTERVSVDSAGNQADADSHTPVISADGRFVAFWSEADNLVPGDTNGQPDVFVHDRKTGATERISVDSAGNQGNNGSFAPAISAKGCSVAFWSFASNLVPRDTNGASDTLVRDRKAQACRRGWRDHAGE